MANSNSIYSNLHVLVVEDNLHFATLLATILRAVGIRNVSRTDNAKSAFNILMQRRFDIVLLDISLKERSGFNLSGYKLLEAVRNKPDCLNRNARFIMISALGEEAHVKQAIHKGADEFLVKPVSPIQLMSRIKRVIENPLPYLKTGDGYYGPERRRSYDPRYRGMERRERDDTEQVAS